MTDNIIVSRAKIEALLDALEDLGMKWREASGDVLYLEEYNAVGKELETAEKAEPVAWEVGGRLCLRIDVRDALTGPLGWRGDYVDMGRAIPDSWVPKLYAAIDAAIKGEK